VLIEVVVPCTSRLPGITILVVDPPIEISEASEVILPPFTSKLPLLINLPTVIVAVVVFVRLKVIS
jgi:uncharacterized membrane protein